MATHDAAAYQDSGVFLLRATTAARRIRLPDDLDLSAEGDPQRILGWLAEVWRPGDFREAVTVASPILARRVGQTLSTVCPEARYAQEARETWRAAASIASYALRWNGRATPFGLFAGVGAASVADDPVARWGSEHRVTLRADAQWLGALVDRLEGHPGLLQRLSVCANSAAFIRGNRLVAPGRPGAGHRRLAPLEVSVRATRPVRAALDRAREPVRCAELIKWLTAEFPRTPPAQASNLLRSLVDHGFLVTGLRAPFSVCDALGHVLSQLDAADADELPELGPLVHELRTVRQHLALTQHAPSMTAVGAIRCRVAERMNAICDAVAQPLVVNVGLDCEIAVPEAVIEEARGAAAVLVRLTPYPFGYPHWKDFHSRFRARYGAGAVVPVRELVQLDTGLGFPAGYLGSPLGRTARSLTGRDEILLALAQQAVIDQQREIVLTDALIRKLTVGDPAELIPPPRIELAVQILAESCDALARGAFRLIVSGAPRPGSSMAGRFADLLPAAAQQRLADSYAHARVPDDEQRAIAAQLSFAPRRRHSENVTRTPQLLPHLISIGEHRQPGERVIDLDDLAVGADARELYLMQRSTGRRIEPRTPHALEAGVQTPPIARFLAEVATARCAVYQGFDWGAAARLPYLPRLRYRRTILFPARWLLSAEQLAPSNAATAAWEATLCAWRDRLQVPAAIVLCESDMRLPLDLDHRAHRALLREHLTGSGTLELREAPTDVDLGWIGRAHELLIPLRSATARTTSSPQRSLSPPHVTARDASHLPGVSRYLCANIHGHPDRFDEILIEYVPDLFDDWTPSAWWFRRYRMMAHPDREQHLRLCVRLPSPDQYADAARRVGDWSARLRTLGLVPHVELCAYQPATGRYGHGPAMAAAENVFAADSAAVLAQLDFAARAGQPARAVTVASLVDLTLSFAENAGDGLRWLINDIPRLNGKLNRELRDRTMTLADPSDDWAALTSLPGGASVVLAWKQRRAALINYRTELAAQRAVRQVMRSLLHAHHTRALTIDPDSERVSFHLARAVAQRQLAIQARALP